MVLDRDVVTTVHQQEVILVYSLSNSSNCNDLECPWKLFSIASLFKWNISYLWHDAWSLCISRASCVY